MPNLTVRKIPKDVYAALRRDAKRHGRSLNAEVLAMLADKAETARRRASARQAMAEIEKLRTEILRKHPVEVDSAEWIREDRDSR